MLELTTENCSEYVTPELETIAKLLGKPIAGVLRDWTKSSTHNILYGVIVVSRRWYSGQLIYTSEISELYENYVITRNSIYILVNNGDK